MTGPGQGQEERQCFCLFICDVDSKGWCSVKQTSHSQHFTEVRHHTFVTLFNGITAETSCQSDWNEKNGTSISSLMFVHVLIITCLTIQSQMFRCTFI